MRFLIIFIFLITNVVAEELPGIKNIVIHKAPKTYDNVIFLDKKDQKININEYRGNLLVLNFWATWCEPCKEEMPSLDKLQANPELDKIKIFAINIGKENSDKVNKFFKDFNIKNFEPYFDPPTTLAKIDKEITNNKFEFNKKYEDIHMNIEKRLFQIIGEEAGYVHTGRSRNDQVITDFKIWMKNSTNEINNNINKVIKSTIKLAD